MKMRAWLAICRTITFNKEDEAMEANVNNVLSHADDRRASPDLQVPQPLEVSRWRDDDEPWQGLTWRESFDLVVGPALIAAAAVLGFVVMAGAFR